MVELIISLIIGVAAYLAARLAADRLDLDPKPRNALIISATLFAGSLANVISRAFV